MDLTNDIQLYWLPTVLSRSFPTGLLEHNYMSLSEYKLGACRFYFIHFVIDWLIDWSIDWLIDWWLTQAMHKQDTLCDFCCRMDFDVHHHIGSKSIKPLLKSVNHSFFLLTRVSRTSGSLRTSPHNNNNHDDKDDGGGDMILNDDDDNDHKDNDNNNTHEEITQFWLVKSSAV